MVAFSDAFGGGWFPVPSGLEFIPEPGRRGVELDSPRWRNYDGTLCRPRILVSLGYGGREIRMRAKIISNSRWTIVPITVVKSLGARIVDLGLAARGLCGAAELAFQARAIDHTHIVWKLRAMVWDRDELVLGKQGFFDLFAVAQLRDTTRLWPAAHFEGVMGSWHPAAIVRKEHTLLMPFRRWAVVCWQITDWLNDYIEEIKFDLPQSLSQLSNCRRDAIHVGPVKAPGRDFSRMLCHKPSRHFR